MFSNTSIKEIYQSEKSIYILIALFVLSKLTHLNIAFFWDEAWVYAPAIKSMLESGPSLLPNAIPLDYSRGHPLLFHFLGSLWMKIFGSTHTSMHSFALAISIFYLIFSSKIIEKVFNHETAFWTLIITILSPLFYAQSSMVLPEILLATCSFGAIYFYLKSKYGLYFIFSIAALLTKETGVLLIFCIVFYDFIRNISKHKSLSNILVNGLFLSLPLLTLLIHMLLLKEYFGWYLYPEHTGMLKTDISSILISYTYVIQDQIFIQKRWLILIPFVLVWVYKMLRHKKNWKKYYLIFSLTSIIAAAVLKSFTLASGLVFLLLFWPITSTNKEKQNLHSSHLLLLFIGVYALFSAANFYTVRYLLSSFPFILAFLVYFILRSKEFRPFSIIYLALLIPIYIIQLINPVKINDVNLTYLNYTKQMSKLVDHLEKERSYHENIVSSFLTSVALNDPKSGYRKTKDLFTGINQTGFDQAKYVIFDNVEPNRKYEAIIKSAKFQLSQKFESGNIWLEIWERSD